MVVRAWVIFLEQLHFHCVGAVYSELTDKRRIWECCVKAHLPSFDLHSHNLGYLKRRDPFAHSLFKNILGGVLVVCCVPHQIRWEWKIASLLHPLPHIHYIHLWHNCAPINFHSVPAHAVELAEDARPCRGFLRRPFGTIDDCWFINFKQLSTKLQIVKFHCLSIFRLFTVEVDLYSFRKIAAHVESCSFVKLGRLSL